MGREGEERPVYASLCVCMCVCVRAICALLLHISKQTEGRFFFFFGHAQQQAVSAGQTVGQMGFYFFKHCSDHTHRYVLRPSAEPCCYVGGHSDAPLLGNR